jgi:hypothetical protein
MCCFIGIQLPRHEFRTIRNAGRRGSAEANQFQLSELHNQPINAQATSVRRAVRGDYARVKRAFQGLMQPQASGCTCMMVRRSF